MKECSHLLATPVTAICNSCFREGVLPKLWKTTTVIPLSKKHPPVTIGNDVRPTSLTPIIAKVFESLVLKWVDVYVKPQIEYGGMAGTCTTYALVEMLHKWYESTDVSGNFVRVLFLYYNKAFYLINHDILLNKMTGMEVLAHLFLWMRYLLDRELRVKIGDCVKTRVSQWGRSPGDVNSSKTLLVLINDLQTPFLYINVLTTALYLQYVTKTWYLLSKILLTLLSNGLVIMACVSIRPCPKRWL